jgi:toxin FitB
VIALDTNVISELMKGTRADPRVVAWVRRPREQPVTTVISRAEVLGGIAVLPAGRRRTQLAVTAEAAFSGLGVCLPLTAQGASTYAEMISARRRAGKPMAGFDALIAAIVFDAGASLATRNIGDFLGVGLNLVDPFSS